MKIPKYRIWHKKLQRMFDVRDISFTAENVGVDIDGEFHIVPFEDLKLMGYLGLNVDKDNKEIFEGDIIRTEELVWFVEPIGTEEEDGGRFGLCASIEGRNYFIDSSHLEGEIIGNIYENSELIAK